MLRIEHLSVEVQGRLILRDLNMHIKAGEVHALFGPNGAGKSTLIGAIMGFPRFRVTEGQIWFGDNEISGLPVDVRAELGIGVMIQRPPTIRGLTLRQMVQLCGREPVDAERLAAKLNLTEFLDRSVNEGFSGGEIKRSELLQLMAQKPDLLLLDEPESGVDLENIALVGAAADWIMERGEPDADGDAAKESLRRRRARRSKSGLIITHTGHILRYVPADTAHVLYDGTISCSGNPQEMLNCIRQGGYEHCIRCATERGCQS